jgi:hypothetical protein
MIFAMRLRPALLLILSCLLIAGCGGSGSSKPTTTTPTENVGDFFKRYIGYELNGQYAQAWKILHPGQQKLVHRNAYVKCQRKKTNSVAGIKLKSVKVLEVSGAPTSNIGVPQKTYEAVTMKITLEKNGVKQPSSTVTYHAIAIDGHWVWLLRSTAVAVYLSGACPA